MSFNVTVVYENKSDAKFDLDYYLKTHMPLVAKNWNQYGLQRWEVVQTQKGPDGSQPYLIQALLVWDSEASFQKAFGSEEAKTVFGDVPNFTNLSPSLFGGAVVGQS